MYEDVVASKVVDAFVDGAVDPFQLVGFGLDAEASDRVELDMFEADPAAVNGSVVSAGD